MPQSYFIWKNKDCRSMGVTMRGPAAIIRPEERVRHVEIPGVSGDLTETEGENIYNSYIQTVSISVKNGMRVKEVYKWLRGAGEVIFSGEPDRKQKARVIGAITLNRISRNMDRWAGEVQFYCQPLKEKLEEKGMEITDASVTIKNYGDVECFPLIKLKTNSTGAAVNVTGRSVLIISGLTSGQVIWVDSQTMEIWNEDRTALLTKDSTGSFPVLEPGENEINTAGVSEMTVWKRERFL